MTVRELLGKLDAREIAEWKAYYELEPFGQDRADAGAAMVAYTVASCNGAKGVTPADFMPRFGDADASPGVTSGEEMLRRAKVYGARRKVFQESKRARRR